MSVTESTTGDAAKVDVLDIALIVGELVFPVVAVVLNFQVYKSIAVIGWLIGELLWSSVIGVEVSGAEAVFQAHTATITQSGGVAVVMLVCSMPVTWLGGKRFKKAVNQIPEPGV